MSSIKFDTPDELEEFFIDDDFDVDGDNEFSLTDLMLSAIASNSSAPLGSTVRVETDMFETLEISQCGKRKATSDPDFEWGEGFAPKKFRAMQQKSSPILWSAALPSTASFSCYMKLDHIVERVEIFLNELDRCVFDFDKSQFTWKVIFMSADGPLYVTVQIFDGSDIQSTSDDDLYVVDLLLELGEQQVFEIFRDDLFSHVIHLTPITSPAFSDPGASFILYSQSPLRAELESKISNILKSPMKVDSSLLDPTSLDDLSSLCSTLNACRGAVAMKTVLDTCRVTYALTRCLETSTDIKKLASSFGCRWIVNYSVRCIFTLTEVNRAFIDDFNAASGRALRNVIFKLHKLLEDDSNNLLQNRELVFAQIYTGKLVQMIREDLSTSTSSVGKSTYPSTPTLGSVLLCPTASGLRRVCSAGTSSVGYFADGVISNCGISCSG